MKRFLGNILKGVLKTVPVVNVIYESAKDLNRKDVADRGRRILNSTDAQKALGTASNKSLKKNLYDLVDVLDDGKLNDSFDRVLFDKVIQILGSVIALGVAVYSLYI